jgi:AdoMet-dependent heme synthase
LFPSPDQTLVTETDSGTDLLTDLDSPLPSQPMPRRHLAIYPVPSALPKTEACELPFLGLDTLWLQLTGTLCNIACRHCFIGCGPKEDRVPMMTWPRLHALLAEAQQLGVKEFYFTGGEPMLHPDFFEVIANTLALGPVHVLSNGILIDAAAAQQFRQLFDSSRYSLELRVSLDGMTAKENDPVRGRGTFASIVKGLTELALQQLSPVITVVEHRDGLAAMEARQAFLAFAKSLGLQKPRVKFLPLLRLGREPKRTHGYHDEDVVRGPLDDAVLQSLQCNNSRLATQDAVLTCPLLLDAPDARLGTTLREALQPIHLRWSACHTCVREGLSCRT